MQNFTEREDFITAFYTERVFHNTALIPAMLKFYSQ